MRLLRTSALLLTGLTAHSRALAQVGRPAPPLHGTLLRGGQITLPDNLHGAPAVLVIGFTQGSRDQVSAWGKRLATVYAKPAGSTETAGVRWFEVAELESVPRLLRGWLTRKIRETVSDRGQGTFLVITNHEQDWKQTVGFAAPDQAYVVVLDGNGTVRGVAHGPVSNAELDRMEMIVAGLPHSR